MYFWGVLRNSESLNFFTLCTFRVTEIFQRQILRKAWSWWTYDVTQMLSFNTKLINFYSLFLLLRGSQLSLIEHCEWSLAKIQMFKSCTQRSLYTSLLSVSGMESRVRSVQKKVKKVSCLACLVVNTYAVRGRTKILREGSRQAARPRGWKGTLVAR